MDSLFVVLALIVALFVLFRTRSASSDEQIRTLYRQTARYAVASAQDEAPVVRLLHANYAMGYLMALKDISEPDQFRRVTGIDLVTFERKVAQVQDAATLGLVTDSPNLIPEQDPVLLKAMYYGTV